MGTSSFSGGISPACSSHGWDWGASGPWGRSAGFEVSSLPRSRAWRPGPVYLGCGHSLEEKQRNVGLVSASSSSGSAQLELRDCFLPFHNHHLCQSEQHQASVSCSKGTAGCSSQSIPWNQNTCGKKKHIQHPQRDEMLHPQNFLLQTRLVVQLEEPWLDSVAAAALLVAG